MKEKNNLILGNYHPKERKNMVLKSSIENDDNDEDEEGNNESKGGEYNVI